METQTHKLRATYLTPLLTSQLARFLTTITSIIVLPASCLWLCAIPVACYSCRSFDQHSCHLHVSPSLPSALAPTCLLLGMPFSPYHSRWERYGRIWEDICLLCMLDRKEATVWCGGGRFDRDAAEDRGWKQHDYIAQVFLCEG